MTKKNNDTSWLDIVKRLNAMSNMTPDQERAELMEAAKHEPRILDDKDISLADIAKLAGIKEYTEQPKVSDKAEKLIESITQEKTESVITKAIKESDADTSIATSIKKEVTEESNRLDKIAELEAQLAELKSEQKEEQTYDSKSFREVISKDIAEYIKDAEDTQLVELYNTISDNEAVYNEESSSILIKTPETTEIIADAEKAEAPEEEVIADDSHDKRNLSEPHRGEEKADDEEEKDEEDEEGEVPMLDPEFDEDTVDVPEQEIEYTNDLSEAKKKPVPTSPDKWSRAKAKARSKFDVYPSAYANAYAAKEYKKMGGGWRMGKPKKKK
jgi:hypothetical protein|tara:strand:+ start:602 stop:1588 length:987 start_codon:yes stop_codon:yes gene_type:complete